MALKAILGGSCIIVVDGGGCSGGGNDSAGGDDGGDNGSDCGCYNDDNFCTIFLYKKVFRLFLTLLFLFLVDRFLFIFPSRKHFFSLLLVYFLSYIVFYVYGYHGGEGGYDVSYKNGYSVHDGGNGSSHLNLHVPASCRLLVPGRESHTHKTFL